MAGDVKPLGELLVSKGLLSAAQLTDALAEQKATKEFLGTIVMRHGWVRKEDVLSALAAQLQIPFMRLDASRIDWTVAKKFSPTAVIEHKSMPIAMDRISITVAVVNPLNIRGIELIEREAGGREVRMALVSEEDYAQALSQYRQKP